MRSCENVKHLWGIRAQSRFRITWSISHSAESAVVRFKATKRRLLLDSSSDKLNLRLFTFGRVWSKLIPSDKLFKLDLLQTVCVLSWTLQWLSKGQSFPSSSLLPSSRLFCLLVPRHKELALTWTLTEWLSPLPTSASCCTETTFPAREMKYGFLI